VALDCDYEYRRGAIVVERGFQRREVGQEACVLFAVLGRGGIRRPRHQLLFVAEVAHDIVAEGGDRSADLRSTLRLGGCREQPIDRREELLVLTVDLPDAYRQG